MNARTPNLGTRSKAGALLPSCLLCTVLVCAVLSCAPVPAFAATYSSTDAPGGNGLRPPDTPMKGRSMRAIGAFADAYGNPVTPDGNKEAVRKERLPGGAMGAQTPREPKERPLPNPADDAPVW